MIRGLIFDFDGLILDTESPEFQSWQEMYQEYGCHLPVSAWTTGISKANDEIASPPYRNLEAQLGRALEGETLCARRRQRYAELVAAQALLPGVEDYLVKAGRLGLKLGLASSSTREWVLGHLRRFGLHPHFACIRCAEDVAQPKPDPALYQGVLDALGLRAEEAVALEDSPTGILAAKRAGIYCVAVPNPLTCQLSLEQADMRLASLAEMSLEALLQHIEKARL